MKYVQAILLVLAIVFGNPASADEASRVEAEKLLDTLGMQAMLDQAVNTTLEAEIKNSPVLTPFKDVMLAFFRKHMSYDVLKPELIEIYAEEFTASELAQIREFYSTPTGKKTIEKLPALMSRGAEIGTKHVQEHIQELQQMIKEESEKIESRKNEKAG